MAPRTRTARSVTALVDSDTEVDSVAIDTAPQQSSRITRPRGRPAGTSSKISKTQTKTSRQRSNAVKKTSPESRQPLSTLPTKRENRQRRPPKEAELKESRKSSPDTRKVSQNGRFERGRSPLREHSFDAPVRRMTDRLEAMDIPETQDYQSADLVDYEHMPSIIDGMYADDHLGGTDGEQPPGIEVEGAIIRRRLGELSKKYNILISQHRDLREIGLEAAERNFQRLKQDAEETTAVSSDLISQLKTELASQIAIVEQGRETQLLLEASEKEGNKLRLQIEDLKIALQTARKDNEILSAKLAACRGTDMAIRQPAGSVLKTAKSGTRGAVPEALQAVHAKEDLYSDLTGLIVRDFRHVSAADCFDCIQTGRNGTLHFKLTLESGEKSGKYDDVQFNYKPQLDNDRDSHLIKILPDYLQEEITFHRPHAPKFYSRVIKSLAEPRI